TFDNTEDSSQPTLRLARAVLANNPVTKQKITSSVIASTKGVRKPMSDSNGSRAASGSTSLCAIASALLRTSTTTIGTRNKMPPTRVVLRKWSKPFIVHRTPAACAKVLPHPRQRHAPAVSFVLQTRGNMRSAPACQSLALTCQGLALTTDRQ